MKQDEAIKTLIKAVLALQKEVRSQKQLIMDNLDFIQGMGDVAGEMTRVLEGMMEDRDAALKNTLEQFRQSATFFKATVSNKYAHHNVMQEWFSDLVAQVISENTSVIKYDVDFVEDWINLKFKSYVLREGNLPATDNYIGRVEFGEKIFRDAMEELQMTEFGQFILRSLYIPYTALYYLVPFVDYPYIDEYFEQIEKFRNDIDTIQEYQESMRQCLKEIEERHEQRDD